MPKLADLKQLFADFEFQKVIDEINQIQDPSLEEIRLKAHSLFELGDFDQAMMIYENLQMYTNLGFCYILKDDCYQAKMTYLKADPSAAKKWGLFLTLLLSRCDRVFPGPGFLTFRLFFESTYYYLLKFKKTDYINRINESAHQLKHLYPEIEKEIKKARSII